MMLSDGDMAPDVTLTMTDGTTCALSDWRGQALLLYFYPKDDTPGCTTEAQSFTGLIDDFTAAGAAVVGVSQQANGDDAETLVTNSGELTSVASALATGGSAQASAYATGVYQSASGTASALMSVVNSNLIAATASATANADTSAADAYASAVGLEQNGPSGGVDVTAVLVLAALVTAGLQATVSGVALGPQLIWLAMLLAGGLIVSLQAWRARDPRTAAAAA